MGARPLWRAQQSVCSATLGRCAYPWLKRRRARYGQSIEICKLVGLLIQANRLWLPSNLPKFELKLPDVLFRVELLRFEGEAPRTAAC